MATKITQDHGATEKTCTVHGTPIHNVTTRDGNRPGVRGRACPTCVEERASETPELPPGEE